jgi:Predicted Zn-dependent protease (DUF2268)
MNHCLRSMLCLLFCVTSIASVAGAQDCRDEGDKSDLVKLNTSDVELFWHAYDLAGPEKSAEVFEREYLNKGSTGLAEFTRLRIGDAKQLAATVRQRPKYYAQLRKHTQKIAAYQAQMQAAFRCFRQLYPEAVFPDVYFVVGRMNSAGTVDRKSLLIGVDMFGRDGDDSLAELGAWHKAVVASIDRLPYIVAHELIHSQQSNARDSSLLAHSLTEGVADFIAERISGQHINPHLHEFARNRHRELWLAFEKEMRGSKLSNWLYQGENATAERPADLGYYMGYRIAAAYYDKQADKRKAIRDMLQIRDADGFLKASGYAEQMIGSK